MKEDEHKRPCNVLEYSGVTTLDFPYWLSDRFHITYKFAAPKMTVFYQERLVFDVIGVMGSVGGTLGMCIGFSFSGMSSNIFGFIKSKMNSYF